MKTPKPPPHAGIDMQPPQHQKQQTDNTEVLTDEELSEALEFEEMQFELEMEAEEIEAVEEAADALAFEEEVEQVEAYFGQMAPSPSSSSSRPGAGDSMVDNGLTPYFDPFFSMFGSFSSQTPSLVVIETSSSSQASGSAVAALEQRIEQLEETNLLLASDFSTNAEAFWDVCTNDVISLCDVGALQQLPCFAAQTSEAANCLVAKFKSIEARSCTVGVERMTTWYHVHNDATSSGAGAADDIGTPPHNNRNMPGGQDYEYLGAMDSFLNFFLAALLFIFLVRCCTACAAFRRRRMAAAKTMRSRCDNSSNIGKNDKPPLVAGVKVVRPSTAAAAAAVAAPQRHERSRSHSCERGEVVPQNITNNNGVQKAEDPQGVYYL